MEKIMEATIKEEKETTIKEKQKGGSENGDILFLNF